MIRQYLKIIRVHIVVGGILAFTVGALLGLANGGTFSPNHFAICYAAVLFGDLSTHFSNDYFDVKQDKASFKKAVFSKHKVLTDKPEMLPLTHKIAVTLLTVSLVISFFAVLFKIVPLEFLLILIGANFLGWFYSAPPLRLVKRGSGEVAIALAVGFAIPTAGYLSTKGALDNWYGLFVIPFILYGFMLALSLEAPDVEGDCLGDKKTLAVTKGTRAVFASAFSAAFAAFLVFLHFTVLRLSYPVDLSVITAFSSLPLIVGFLGLLQICKGKNARIPSAINVASLFAINILIVVYLIVTIFLWK